MANREKDAVSKIIRSKLDALFAKYSIAKMLEDQLDDFYEEEDFAKGIYNEEIQILQKFLLELLDDET